MSSTIIGVDASFVIRLLNSNSEDSPFIIIWQEWQIEQSLIIAPSLFYYEIANAFYRYVLAKQIDLETAKGNIREALNLPIRIYGDSFLHEKALTLANLLKLPAAYDAHYLALSEHLNGDFYTSDKKLYNSVKNTLTWVYLIEE
ncbi:MAG: type II toxin-antitoxin system VapC family toxin [Crocosphaera sp.]|nr:type II toxin-antitoxin system VapC family toxin [Crocosphaera sp.]